MEVLPSDLTDVIVRSAGREVVGYQTTVNGVVTRYALEDIWHGKYFNPLKSGIVSHRGMSPLQVGS